MRACKVIQAHQAWLHHGQGEVFRQTSLGCTIPARKKHGLPQEVDGCKQEVQQKIEVCLQIRSACVGPWWQATNSFRQDSSGAVRGVTLPMGLWVKRQVWILPRAMVGNFFDYCLIITDTKAQRQKSMNESDKFDTLTGQRVGHEKTVAFGARMDPRDELTSRGTKLRSVEAEKALGILMRRCTAGSTLCSRTKGWKKRMKSLPS